MVCCLVKGYESLLLVFLVTSASYQKSFQPMALLDIKKYQNYER